jgi:hypothetical protein
VARQDASVGAVGAHVGLSAAQPTRCLTPKNDESGRPNSYRYSLLTGACSHRQSEIRNPRD